MNKLSTSPIGGIKPPPNSKIRVVVAESDPQILSQLLETLEGMGKWIIYPCCEYKELNDTLSQGSPDLLLLGNVNQGSCFDVCRQCRKDYEHLPIVLVSHEAKVPDFYRQWVSEKGFGDVVSSAPAERGEFISVIQNIVGVIQAQKQAQSLSLPNKDNDAPSVFLEIDGQPTKAKEGARLLSILLANHVKVLKACGGQGRCATCHVYVNQGMNCLTPPTEQEKLTLSLMKIDREDARLACQCRVIGNGLAVEVPKGKYVGSEAEMEALVGKKAQQTIIHPITGEVLVREGKLILRSALEKMQAVNQQFEKDMAVMLSRKPSLPKKEQTILSRRNEQ
jgi:ferredoxin